MADPISNPVETPKPVVEQPKTSVPETIGPELGVEKERREGTEGDRVEGSENREEETIVEPVPTEPIAPIRRAPVQTVAPAKDKILQKIEDILGEEMTDTFLKLSPDRQKLFKEKGEEIAGLIKQMIESAKVNTKKIFDLIRKWLKLIPGINQFFLEQEAKIKTDKILNIKP